MDKTIEVSETVESVAKAAAAVLIVGIVAVVFASVVQSFKQDIKKEEPKQKIFKIK